MECHLARNQVECHLARDRIWLGMLPNARARRIGKNEMSLVPGYKKPRARMMLVRYNGHVSLFKNGWRMYEWSEEDHKNGYLWLGHFADLNGQFCVEDVYLCN